VRTPVYWIGRRLQNSDSGGIFRVLLSEAAALVLFWRTRAIWNKCRAVSIGMLVVLVPITVVSFASIAHQRGASVDGNCTGHAGDSVSPEFAKQRTSR
jgi:hypothetical protein